MSGARALLTCCAIAIATSLALARIHPFGDAGLYATRPAKATILESSSVPPEVRAILSAKCADCHSSLTRVPLYGRSAPASWLMERDIVRGRQAMNFSLWNSYSAEQQQRWGAKIVQETREHEMPPLQYRMIHWRSTISDADSRVLAVWSHGMPGTSGAESDQSTIAGDPSRGKIIFVKHCTGCHSLTENREGPKLLGGYERASGTVEGYDYSPALKKAHIVWDEESLGKWLTDPDAFIPGNNMDFLVSKPQERLDLISFLKQGSGK